MRIVAGTHGSRKLNTLDGMNTRPTGDKVRAAMFSRIGPFFNGGTFLDLFAGSGACGLEAISRGMEKAIFVEKNPKAIKVIESNIKLLKENDKAKVLRGDSMKIIESIKEPLDVIFLDPPYDFPQLEELIEKIVTSQCIDENTDLIIETDSKNHLQDSYGSFIKVQEKSYGLACLHYYVKGENHDL